VQAIVSKLKVATQHKADEDQTVRVAPWPRCYMIAPRMMLTLAIRNKEDAEGAPPQLVLDGGEATIGRSPACDWTLPDPDKFISSRHCQIRFSDGGYVLADLSTNGTFLNGSVERMPTEHRIENGDVFQIGRYQIQATLGEPTKAEAPAAEPTQPPARAPELEPEHAATQYVPSDQLWQMVTAGSDVDWSRGGFGGAPGRDATVWQPAPLPETADAAVGEAPADTELDRLVAAFLQEARLSRADVPEASPDTLLRAARLMQRMVSGLVVMVEARARAKAQMGAEATAFSPEGNNPIKFARTPEQALARLLSPPEPGFMEGERAVEDALVDLQAHQVATLKAMQGALKTALNRFSPDAIRRRAELKGLFARILPTARDAALWQNYEREFGLVAQESDEAFLEVFAKQFRKAYEELARQEAKR
jgi:type VI secretion system protein